MGKRDVDYALLGFAVRPRSDVTGSIPDACQTNFGEEVKILHAEYYRAADKPLLWSVQGTIMMLR